MLEFNLSQNMMAGTKLSHPNGKIQFCPMEDTFVQLPIATDFFAYNIRHCMNICIRADTLSCETLYTSRVLGQCSLQRTKTLTKQNVVPLYFVQKTSLQLKNKMAMNIDKNDNVNDDSIQTTSILSLQNV